MILKAIKFCIAWVMMRALVFILLAVIGLFVLWSSVAAAEPPFDNVIRVTVPTELLEVANVTELSATCTEVRGRGELTKRAEGTIGAQTDLTFSEGELGLGRWTCTAEATFTTGASISFFVTGGPTDPFVSVDRTTATLQVEANP